MIKYDRIQIRLVFLIILLSYFIVGISKIILISSLFLLVSQLNNWEIRINKNHKKIILAYFLYVISELISLALENPGNFTILRTIVPRHFISILVVLTYAYLEPKHKVTYLKWFYIFILLSALVSIAQLIGYEWGIDLYKYLYPFSDKLKEVKDLQSITEQNLAFYGYPGLFENVVISSQYYSSFILFSFFFFTKKKWLQISLFIFLLIAIFSLQLRSGLYSALITSTLFIFLYYRKLFWLLFLPGISYLLWRVGLLIDQINLRVLDSSSPIREKVNEVFWDYVGEGHFFGNRELYANKNEFLKNQGITTPHNLFKNSYVLAGIPGLITSTYIVLFTFFQNYTVVFSHKKSYIIIASLFSYLINALTHNNSFLFGDTLFIILTLSYEKKNTIYSPRFE